MKVYMDVYLSKERTREEMVGFRENVMYILKRIMLYIFIMKPIASLALKLGRKK